MAFGTTAADLDPIAVKLAVRGTGNLDSLRAPALTGDLSDWKTYDPSRLERQGERRDITGQVVRVDGGMLMG